MSPLTITLIGFVSFFLLVFLRMPFGFAFAFTGFIGLVLLKGLKVALGTLGVLPYSSVAIYVMVALPLFILMGQFTYRSGISRDLYEAAHKAVGRAPGGIALATNLACTAFAACTGSSLASAATMATIALPEMKSRGYDMKLATGSIAAGGTLGILIPPSTMFIIYGYLTEQSVGRLFIAGIFPGLILSGLFSMWILFVCLRNRNLGPPGPSYPLREVLSSLKGIWGMLALFILVIGGLYIGIFTPSEAGAIGAFGAFALSVLRRRLSWQSFLSSIKESAEITCFILIILVGVAIFNNFLVHAGFQTILRDWVLSLKLSPNLLIALIIFLYIPMGMFMDTLAMLLLTVPIFFPIVTALGFDPIWYGVIMVVIIEAALITPPVGVNVFVIRTLAPDVPLSHMFWGAIPFFILMMVGVAIFALFPQICLFLPNLMMKG
jgi:C4-dicarboxylate transporter DctM subunit